MWFEVTVAPQTQPPPPKVAQQRQNIVELARSKQTEKDLCTDNANLKAWPLLLPVHRVPCPASPTESTQLASGAGGTAPAPLGAHPLGYVAPLYARGRA